MSRRWQLVLCQHVLPFNCHPHASSGRPKRWKSQGPMLPTKLIICCCSMAERWLPTLATILIMCAVISISLDLLKRSWLAGNLQQMPTVTSWLQILDTSFFCARIQALMQWWDRWLNVNCEYVEVSCVLSAPCVPCMHWSQNKVLSFEVFVTLCFWNSFVENC